MVIRRNPQVRRYRRYSSRDNPVMKLMKYGVSLGLALVKLRYQQEQESLFQKNPAPVWCFVAATAAYWLTVGGKWRRAALAFAILSAASLLAMFLPYPFSLLPLLVWVPVALLLTWPPAARWITTAVGRISANKPPVLPL